MKMNPILCVILSSFFSCYRMGQNMNTGVQYFKDFLFVEADILIASIVWDTSLREAECRLYPMKYLLIITTYICFVPNGKNIIQVISNFTYKIV